MKGGGDLVAVVTSYTIYYTVKGGGDLVATGVDHHMGGPSRVHAYIWVGHIGWRTPCGAKC